MKYTEMIPLIKAADFSVPQKFTADRLRGCIDEHHTTPTFPQAYVYKKQELLGKVKSELKEEMNVVCDRVRQLWVYSAQNTLKVDGISAYEKISPWTKSLRLMKIDSRWPERGIIVR